MDNRSASLARLGMLTPSSNTVLEPLVARMVASVPGASAHFARLRVTEITLERGALAQFDASAMLAAAALLADARVHAIAWNGTAASWMGFDRDILLCQQIARRFGVPATSAVLAINDLLQALGARRFALVSPYVDTVQAAIIASYEAAGFACVAERHEGESDNYAFADIPEATVADAVREVARARPDAIVVMCTNLRGAALAEPLERETGIALLDSVSACVWKSLLLAGADPSMVKGWGRLFGVAAETIPAGLGR